VRGGRRVPSAWQYARRVLFERRLRDGLADGSIRLAFRRWRRSQVVGGRQYRSPIGLIQVDRVSVVADEISLGDAQAAGYASVAALLGDLKGPSDAAIYRLELHRSADADPRAALAEDALLDEQELSKLSARLARLDGRRPWITATLQAIQQHPGARAADLMGPLGWSELHDFKMHVRKLKELGLTHSLRIGYRLAPRGEAYLRKTGLSSPSASA
jgi:hypothetical protein